MAWHWSWPFGWSVSSASDSANDGAWKSVERSVVPCGVRHACGGTCFMYDMNKEWIHHCGDWRACELSAHK